ncbi:hypothetical protein BJ508DRAFT_417029 [Ascobolus immersus RN42]|uniref:Kelch repeat protein n=1 Tax=Ascobolus immersus RN42 TaxID=1160509 RepID=A0A3N4HUI8_ASCIM|nr:hypothetical protein BJ508DRAFT_417029 [Ascobolus immersus RN42]
MSSSKGPREFCWSREQMSTVHKGKVYLTGGFITESTTRAGPPDSLFGNPDIIVYDFSKSSSDIPAVTKIPYPITDIPVLKWGSFWSLGDDTDKLLLSQGELQFYHPGTSEDHLKYPKDAARVQPDGRSFEYDISSNTWKTSTTRTKEGVKLNSAARVSTTFSKSGKGFALGGRMAQGSYMDSNSQVRTSNPGMVLSQFSSMLIYDSKQNGGTWTNQTTELDTNESGTLNVVEGVGKEGLLVFLGGNTGDETQWRSLRTIQVYDIEAGRWYQQDTTATSGFYPPERIHHCTVAASSPDGSSHNIYMYGGWASTKNTLSDVWVLSLPAFHWTRLSTTGGDGVPRMDMACEAVGRDNRYMFVFGGDPGLGPAQKCDKDTKPGQLLDLTTGQWGRRFDVEKRYEVPDAVYASIGGDSTGGATMKEPREGFVDPALKALFVQKQTSPGKSSSGGPEEVEDTGSTTGKKSKGLPTSGIVGVVVGVIAVLLLLGLVAFLIRRRKKKARYSYEGPISESQGHVVGELEGTEQSEAKRYNTTYYTGAPAAPTELPVYGSERVELPTSERRTLSIGR